MRKIGRISRRDAKGDIKYEDILIRKRRAETTCRAQSAEFILVGAAATYPELE